MKMTSHKSWNPRRFDVLAFAEAGASLDGVEPLDGFERLLAERHAGGGMSPVVNWSASGEMRPDAAGKPLPWLHLQVRLDLPVGCQRCLGPVVVALEVDRWFRFAADEAAAEAEDDDSEEDVLAMEPRPDLLGLVEDELLMAIPLVPMHEQCPEPLVAPQARADADAQQASPEERPHPFAALARLKK